MANSAKLGLAKHWIGVSLQAVGSQILEASSPQFKMTQTRLAAEAWRQSVLSVGPCEAPPLFPARPERPILLDAKEMRHCAGVTLEVEMLHSLAHIELGAIDNYWDTIVRFDASYHSLPRAYFDDLVGIADDEAKHLGWLLSALRRKGSSYGELPAHKGLLEHAANTHTNLLARLAVVPLIQEARGLDAGPKLIQKLISAGARESAKVVDSIVRDESNHVRIGMRWFEYLCKRKNLDPMSHFHELVLQFFPQGLPGPFAEAARVAAGMPLDFFKPVSRDKMSGQQTR